MDLNTLIDKIAGDLGDKKKWREYRARAARMPAPYRDATLALERYLLNVGGVGRSDVLVAMVSDLADLFEQAAADGTPIRSVVGDDPVEFAEDFVRNYAEGQWMNKERARLTGAIARAEQEEPR